MVANEGREMIAAEGREMIAAEQPEPTSYDEELSEVTEKLQKTEVGKQ